MVVRLVRKGLVGLMTAGAILASSTLSGCGSLIEFAGRENAANIERDGRIRAAQITANAQNGQLIKKYSFFACNYWKDMNGNKMIDPDIEFVGVKDKFENGETVSFVGHIEGRIGQQVSLELYDSNQNIRKAHSFDIRQNNYFAWLTFGNKVPEFEQLIPGTYVAVWKSAGGEFLGKNEINVLKPEPKYVSKVISVGRSNSFENDVLFGSDLVGAVYQGGEGGPIGANVGDLIGVVYQGGEGGPIGANVGEVIEGKVYRVSGEGGPIGAKAGDLVIERTNGNIGGPAQTVGGSRFPEGRKVISPHKN